MAREPPRTRFIIHVAMQRVRQPGHLEGGVDEKEYAQAPPTDSRHPPLRPASVPEPARPPHGAELLLLGGVLERRLVALGRRRVAVQEVHLDLADEPAAKPGVADPDPPNGAGGSPPV